MACALIWASVCISQLCNCSVVEVYAEDGDVAITSRIYPTLPDSIGVELFADNASALFQLTAWQMADM
jgi:sucrose-6-phosphate hydrolase SacC (GH32 family)